MDSWVPGSLDPLGPLHLPAGDHLVLNLLHEGPDHKEEVGAKHPPEDAADDVHDVEADEGPQDVQDLKDEIHYSQVDPRPHEADVPLKYKYIRTRNQPRIQMWAGYTMVPGYLVSKFYVGLKGKLPQKSCWGLCPEQE